MSIWDGSHPADFIGRRLSDPWFPFGIGLPFAAAKGMCDYLDVAASDPQVIDACVTATRGERQVGGALTSEVVAALTVFVQHVRQEANK